MTNKYTIIAPHPDDEFIGCRQFILANKNDIENVIIATNGLSSLYEFPEPSFAYQRRKESEGWLKSALPKINIHYLNLPDNFETSDFYRGHGIELFKKTHGMDKFLYLKSKIKEIVQDNIVVFNGPSMHLDEHPTHGVVCSLCCNLYDNPYIYYSIRNNFDKTKLKPGLHVAKDQYDQNIYTYVLSAQEYETKLKEFQLYYVSQHEDFQRSNFQFQPHETYTSKLTINLRAQ